MPSQDLSQKLGKPVSPFAFGVMQFGGKADAAASRAMYDMSRAAGITVFDAAYIYTEGNAETLLGDFAEAERDDLVLISKCLYEAPQTKAQIQAQVAESLKRLRTEQVDVLYLHRYPGDEHLDDALIAMRDLHAQGAFALLGASNFAAWQVMKAQARAAQLGAPRIEVLQPMYNLVKRQAEVEILPMAIAEGLTVHTYSPLGGGLLTGKYLSGGAGRLTEDARYKERYGQAHMEAAAVQLAALAAQYAVDAATLAISWVARTPGVGAPIVSASGPEQLGPSLDAIGFDMPDALYQELSALIPAPPPATDRTEEAGA